jgi:hypothetical protein
MHIGLSGEGIYADTEVEIGGEGCTSVCRANHLVIARTSVDNLGRD